MTIIIIITIIKINWPINLDQKDQEQMPNTKRSISGSIWAQLSPSPTPQPGLFKRATGAGECSKLSGRRLQEFLESLIFSARPNTDSSSNSVNQRIQTNSPERIEDSPTTPPPNGCLSSQLYHDREETEQKQAKLFPSQISTRLRCFQARKTLPSPAKNAQRRSGKTQDPGEEES